MVNDLNYAEDVGLSTSKNEINLGGGLTYTRYAWAYNACGYSTAVPMTAQSSPTFCIGQLYQGGIIFYIDGTGQHGLIAAPTDLPGTISWTNGNLVSTGAQNVQIGYGNSNTNQIVSVFGNTGSYAAKLCLDLSLNGYSDWFLPTKDELNQMYLHKSNIQGFDEIGEYWSSSEAVDGYNVWYQYFFSGSQLTQDRYTNLHVRAVRQF
jgi:hypothetical protein